jgi:hypothetical protein
VYRTRPAVKSFINVLDIDYARIIDAAEKRGDYKNNSLLYLQNYSD